MRSSDIPGDHQNLGLPPDNNASACTQADTKMLTTFGVSIVLYFIWNDTTRLPRSGIAPVSLHDDVVDSHRIQCLPTLLATFSTVDLINLFSSFSKIYVTILNN